MIAAREATFGIITIVNTIASSRKKAMETPMVLPAFSFSPMPICWPINTVVPIAKPAMVLVMTLISCEPVETADTSALVAN